MAELTVPRVDFSPLGDLPELIRQNQNRQKLSDLGRDLASGTVDYRTAAGRVADMGDITHTLQFLALAEAQKKQADQLQASNEFKRAIVPEYGGSSVPPATPMPNPAPAVPNPMPVPGAKPMSLASLGPVQSTPKVVGDAEGVQKGYYDPPQAPGMRPPVQPIVSGESNSKIPALIGAMSNPNLPQGDKELAKTLLTHELGKLKPNERAEYLREMKANPDLLDIEMKLKAAGKTDVTIDQKGETEFAKAAGSSLGKRFEKLSEEGQNATQDLALVGQLRDLGAVVKTGAPAAIQGWLAERGIKVGDNVGAVEAYGSIIDKLTPQQRVPGSGATSDYEGRMFKNSLPKLINTPDGNAIISDTLAGLAQYKLDRAAIAEKALTREITPAEALKQMRELPNPYSKFQEFAKSGFRADPNNPASASPSFSDRFGAARPGNQDGARIVPSTKVEIDQSLANARARIARDPGSRNMVLQKLKEAGLPTDGL